MDLSLIYITDEDNNQLPVKSLSEESPEAFSRLIEMVGGADIEANSESDMVEMGRKAASKTTPTGRAFVVGSSDLLSGREEKAVHLVVFKVHREGGDSVGSIFPRVDSQWREAQRELVWRENDKATNCSIIRYSKKSSQVEMSVIISTFNAVEWLEKALWGYQAQQWQGFELIIADDGSKKETYDTIMRLAPELSFPIKHVWHSDAGFRKCNILNKAIAASAADYVLFSDGDCIPRSDFTRVHIERREQGRFLSNGYYKLSMTLSELISKSDILSGRCFDLKWLKAQGLKRTFKNNKFTRHGFKERMLNALTPTKPTWNGHGASVWRENIIEVNGFDTRMKYGGEDREFGERLENNAIRGKQIRYSTVCLHLDHARGYVSQQEIDKNIALRKNTRRKRVLRTKYGINND